MPHIWQNIEEAAVTLGVSTRTIHRRIVKEEIETRLDNGRREVLVCLPDEEQQGAGMTSDSGAAAADRGANWAGSGAYRADGQRGESMRQGGEASASADLAAEMLAAFPARFSPDMTDTIVGLSGTLGAHAANEAQLVTAAPVTDERMLAVAEDRLRRADLALSAFERSLVRVEEETKVLRRGRSVAWGMAGGLACLAAVTCIWATHRVSQASAASESLVGQVKGLSDSHDAQARELEEAKRQAQAERGEALAARSDAKSARDDALLSLQSAEQAKVAAARAQGELAAERTAAEALRASDAARAKDTAALMAAVEALEGRIAPATRPTTRP